MSCDRIRPLLSAYHDDTLSAEQRTRVRAHLSTCAGCTAVLMAYQSTYATLQGTVPPVPPDLRRNVYARIADIEARDSARLPLGPALLGILRAAGGTAGLLAVLAALVAAVVHLGVPQHAGGLSTASPARGVGVAGTVVGNVLGAVRAGNLSALPVAARTAIAPLGHAVAGDATWKVDKISVGAAGVTVDVRVLRLTHVGAPLIVLPVRVRVALPRSGSRSAIKSAVIKNVAVGTPSPIPTIPAGDGIVYVRLTSARAFFAYSGASQAAIEWHAFVSRGRPLVLVTPGPSTTQLFTALSASLDGDAFAYAVAGRGRGSGIFGFALTAPHPRQLVAPYGAVLPRSGHAGLLVTQISPLWHGRLVFSLAGTAAVSIAITSSHGMVTLAQLRQPDGDYAVSPDMRQLAWAQFNGDHVDVLHVSDLGASPVTRTIGLGSHPAWAPDGRDLLFLQQTGGRNSLPALAVWSTQDGSIRRLVQPDPAGHRFISAFAWAPGGRFFTYVVTSLGPRGASTVWLGDAQTDVTWRSFTDHWIGAVAWVHGPAWQAAAPPTATPTPRPVVITVQSGGVRQIVGPAGTTIVPYGSGFIDVVLRFPALLDRHSVDAYAQPATWKLEVKNPPGSDAYAFGLRGSMPGTITIRLAKALGRDGRPLISGPIRFAVQALAPPVALPTPYAETAAPADVLLSFYNALNRRDYARAYSYQLDKNGRTLSQFMAGYGDTRYVRIVRLTPASYLTAANYHAISCVGIQLRAQHWDGRTVDYGGWYMVESTTGQNPRFADWRLLMSGTDVRRGGAAVIPPQARCTPPPKPTPTASAR